MKRLAYPQYRDSGVAWLGEVPEGWDTVELRRFTKFITSGSRGWAEHYADEGKIFVRIGNLTRQAISIDLSDIQYVDPPAGAEGERTKIQLGDVLFSITAYIGSVAVATEEVVGAYINQHIALVRLNTAKLSPKYTAYSTLADFGQAQLSGQGYGGTKVQLSLDDVKSLRIPFPSFYEQTAIAAFLDRETGRIDTLVAKKRTLLGLLKEKRSALISRTVTRGLPAAVAREFGLEPHTRFKDSGIDWLGEVPAGWEVMTVKRVAHTMICGPFGSSLTKDKYSESGYRVYGQEQVIPDDFSIGNYYIPADYFLEMRRYEVNPGDVLVSCVGTFGKVAVVPKGIEPGIINPRLILIRPSLNKIAPDYMGIFIRSHAAHEQLQSASRGGTMDIINLGLLGELVIPLPPLPEQTAIATFLDRETTKIDCLVAKVEAVIERLQEYRTALITAAVTGTIDVRATPSQESRP